MSPPLTCPPPQPEDRDCPLYDARLDLVSDDAALRRLIVRERHKVAPSLSTLIRAEATAPVSRPPLAALPPAAEPDPLPIPDHLKGVPHEQPAGPR
jgi:hypothetical protein